MIMSREEKERRWKEMVERSSVRSGKKGVRSKERRDWSKELISDLKLLGILMVFWFLFGLFVEFV